MLLIPTSIDTPSLISDSRKWLALHAMTFESRAPRAVCRDISYLYARDDLER